MKFVFFGTPEFAAIILEKLINAGFIPQAVVCNPDKPVGRKKIITPPPVKKLLIEKFKDYKIKILQPETFQSFNSSILQSFNPDIFIIAAYGRIIPEKMLKIPRLGSIGIHPSLLPRLRGPSPIQSTILNNEEETGTTLFLMDEKIDHGPILATSHLPIATNDNYKLLMKKLAELSADLLIEILPDIEEKIRNAKPQNENQATYTKKFKNEDAFIKPSDLEKAQKQGGEIARKIDRKIRAFNPEPGAWTIIKKKRVKLLEGEIKENKLELIKIQVEGKKPQILSK